VRWLGEFALLLAHRMQAAPGLHAHVAAYVEPHCYDLCAKHAERLTVPRGWDVVRLPGDPVQQSVDDLEALANAVREASQQRQQPPAPPGPEPVGQGVEVGRRRHLRMVRSAPPETASSSEPAGRQPTT
jgi:hypothetical protein